MPHALQTIVAIQCVPNVQIEWKASSSASLTSEYNYMCLYECVCKCNAERIIYHAIVLYDAAIMARYIPLLKIT